MTTKIVILGDKNTGKTTLYNFLIKSSGNEETHSGNENLLIYDRLFKEASFFDLITLNPDVSEQRFFRLKEDIFIFNSDFDFSGDEINRGKWEKVICNADCVFYLINANLVYENNSEYLLKIEEHVTFIKNIIERNDLSKKLYLICTHCDTVEAYSIEKSTFFEIIFKRLIKVNQKDTEIIAGSLNDEENLIKVAENICEYLILEKKSK